MSGKLHPPKRKQRQQAADVQAVGRRIEADVGRTTPRGEVGRELGGRRDVRDQPTMLQISEQVRWHGAWRLSHRYNGDAWPLTPKGLARIRNGRAGWPADGGFVSS
jgi:hypothetical protein